MLLLLRVAMIVLMKREVSWKTWWRRSRHNTSYFNKLVWACLKEGTAGLWVRIANGLVNIPDRCTLYITIAFADNSNMPEDIIGKILCVFIPTAVNLLEHKALVYPRGRHRWKNLNNGIFGWENYTCINKDALRYWFIKWECYVIERQGSIGVAETQDRGIVQDRAQ